MRIPKLIIPILVIAAIFGGYFLRTAFTQPTTNTVFNTNTGARAVFFVDGLKCKGTATFFTSLYKDVPGIMGIETFASDNKAVFSYNPDLITLDSIKTIMEARVSFEDGTDAQIFTCRSVE